MRIKIVEPGWERYSGQLGWTNFTNGVSDDEVSKAEAQHLAAVVRIEEFDVATGAGTGKSPSVAQVILDTQRAAMSPATLVTADKVPPAAVMPAKVYTPDELAAIADAEGIKGIRRVSDALGLKGTSIAELIGKVLQAQEEAVAKAKAAADAAAAAATVATPAGEQ